MRMIEQVPASEYEALCDAFAIYADSHMDSLDDVRESLAFELGDEDAAFVARALESGFEALGEGR